MFKTIYEYKDFGESITSEDGGRVYVTDKGNKYPSITTVLSELSREGIAKWREKVGTETANKISQTATVRGTKLHSLVEDHLQNKEVDLSNSKLSLLDVQLFKNFKPVLEKINNIHAQELAMYSDHLRTAGRADLIAEYEGKLSVIDFKTSGKLKKKEYIESYFMQCAAYAIMYEERTGIPVSNLCILIAVEDEAPQIFLERRDNWTKKLIDAIRSYEVKYAIMY
jgi:genome maintenance exonuclease 1